MKEYRGKMILTSAVILLPMLIGVLLWNKLPDEIATHFALDGTPNGWTGKGFTVFGIPLFLLVCHWLCVAATMSDPKRKNMSEKLFSLILWFIPVVSLLTVVTCYGYALGYETSNGDWACVLLGVMFIVIGNYLPKCRQNYTMGIKLPWTLHDEDNWNHTHRMAGYLWILCGILMFLNVFLQVEWMTVAVIALAGIIPTIYSYWYYQKHKED